MTQTALLDQLLAAGLVDINLHRLTRHLAFLYQVDDDWSLSALACTLALAEQGSVCCDLADTVSLDQLCVHPLPIDWPAADQWLNQLSASGLVSPAGQASKALVVDSGLVYLQRYWRDQQIIVDALLNQVDPPPDAVTAIANQVLDGQPPAAHRPSTTGALGSSPWQHPHIEVIAGGPGTGKTTLIGQLIAEKLTSANPPQAIALTAPTGRAAAHLQQAVTNHLAHHWPGQAKSLEKRLWVGTVHRLLGWNRQGRVSHHRGQPILADLVVVDEASMLSLPFLARLIDALQPGASLILVGDPDQLTAIDAGAVLADLVAVPEVVAVRQLTTVHRYRGEIAELAQAVHDGDADRALSILNRGGDSIEWLDLDPSDPLAIPEPAITGLKTDMLAQAERMRLAGLDDQPNLALSALDEHRLLLANRHGQAGLQRWTSLIQSWIDSTWRQLGQGARWPIGLPVLITRNDEQLGLFNGDSGVIIKHLGRPHLAVLEASSPRLINPDLISAWEPLFASTVHKSQGSQYRSTTLVLPESAGQLASRQLIYTAITRAEDHLRLIGSAQAIRQAINTPVLRASGLTAKLQGSRVSPSGNPLLG
ncbi:MAG: exodeoxyribonuclease V subunit alpha [Propionibacteriaceae bacterium]|jgi:exodeoxyribonuclease V alpha subunit|nr:exodeoxyribonuclease V subunit alpha [Propionibacteriaceae bacterium]